MKNTRVEHLGSVLSVTVVGAGLGKNTRWKRCAGTLKQGGGWCKGQLWSLVVHEGCNMIYSQRH